MADVVLNKKVLAETIAEEFELTKTIGSEIVELVLDHMTKVLKKGGTVDLYGFGKFSVKKRAARKGINPLTKESIKIPASKAVSFKAAKALKDSLKK